MNLYQRIKAAVTTRQAAENYGLKVSPSGMALCPFHDDHQPSLKLDKRYYCFGCGEQGMSLTSLPGISESVRIAPPSSWTEILASIPIPLRHYIFSTKMQS